MSNKRPSWQRDEVEVLIGETEALLTEYRRLRKAHRASPSVRYIFHPSHRPQDDETPSPIQKEAINWRQKLASISERLRSYYVRQARQAELDLYPFAQFGSFGSDLNPFYPFGPEDVISALEKQRDELQRELQHLLQQPPSPGAQTHKVNPEPLTVERMMSQWPQILRKARSDGHMQPQKQAADKVGVSEGTYKKYEQGNRPGIGNLHKVLAYVTSGQAKIKGAQPQ